MINRLISLTTGTFLVLGLSLVFAGTTVVVQGQVAWDEGSPAYRSQTLQVEQLSPGMEFHRAAPASAEAADEAGRVLFIGMLLILAALLLYTMHVVRLQREDAEKAPWHRMRRWLQTHLDMRLAHHLRG